MLVIEFEKWDEMKHNMTVLHVIYRAYVFWVDHRVHVSCCQAAFILRKKSFLKSV